MQEKEYSNNFGSSHDDDNYIMDNEVACSSEFSDGCISWEDD